MHPILETFFRQQIDLSSKYHLFEASTLNVFMEKFVEKLIDRRDKLQKRGDQVFLYYSISGDYMDLIWESSSTAKGKAVVRSFGITSREQIRSLWKQIIDFTGK